MRFVFNLQTDNFLFLLEQTQLQSNVTLLYKQHFYKQHLAEIYKISSKC